MRRRRPGHCGCPWRWGVVTGLLCGLAAVTAGGCMVIVPGTLKGPVVTSPDKTVEARACLDEIVRGISAPGASVILRSDSWRSYYVRWRRRGWLLPKQCRLKLRDPYMGPGLPGEEIRLVFSADSRHFAAITKRNIWVIRVDTGDRFSLTDQREHVTSFAWLAPGDVGYATHAKLGGGDENFYTPRDRFDITFWWHPIDPAGQPVIVHRIHEAKYDSYALHDGDPQKPQHDWRADGSVVDRTTGRILLVVGRDDRMGGWIRRTHPAQVD